mgnify:FL=1
MAASEHYVECSCGGSQPCDLETVHISTLEPFDASSFVSTSFFQTLELDSAPVILIWNLALSWDMQCNWTSEVYYMLYDLHQVLGAL